MSNQFKGIPFKNERGENLCYCNSGTNALLSSEKITSQITQEHCEVCFACDFLYWMINASPHPRIKSAEPLKALVAEIDPKFDNSEQQDLTRSSVLIKTECKSCGNIIREESTRYIAFENPVGSSMAEIFSNTERILPGFLSNCATCTKMTYHERTEELLMLPDVLIVKFY